ncbi:MAG: HAD family hydrolase [Lachnoclostridium sp.]|nr:HAD family hydrolase [Lachnoclostridium sp.]
MDTKWLFFDIGSTLINEQIAYEHRFRDIADAAGVPFEKVYKMALEYYKQGKKGDLETAKAFGTALPKWHVEDEILYEDTLQCLETLSLKYKIGVIANQAPGTKARLERQGISEYIDLVIASAEEGVAKPDRKLFEIALERSRCEAFRAVMIGDRIDNDIVPANLTGMKTIWIKRGFWQYWDVKEEAEKPDFVVGSLAELGDFLLL